MFHSRPEMLAGTMADQRGQDGQVTCLGPGGSSRTPGHLPRAGCQDSLWDSCILEWPTLADRQASPTTQPLPASPSLPQPHPACVGPTQEGSGFTTRRWCPYLKGKCNFSSVPS